MQHSSNLRTVLQILTSKSRNCAGRSGKKWTLRMKTAFMRTQPKVDQRMRNFLPLASDHGPAKRA